MEFHEEMDETLIKQFLSVKKYGGFYISQHTISEFEEPSSIRNHMPWTGLTFSEAVIESKKLAKNIKGVESHLLYGAEFDSVLEWILHTRNKSVIEVIHDSSSWGNYSSDNTPNKIAMTGSSKKYCVNNIFDLAGNVWQWTNEKNGDFIIKSVIRGGAYDKEGNRYPASYRYTYPHDFSSDMIGFRVALCIA